MTLRQKGWYSRGYLPHVDAVGVTQFVTIRLYDAVPSHLILRWREQLSLGSEVVRSEAEAALELQRQILRYEDQGCGACFLRDPAVALIVREVLFETVPSLLGWVIMPNHLHFLFRQDDHNPLGAILRSFKGRSARRANQVLERSGSFWFPDYFDRMIRNDEHLNRTIFYIEQNPVKAGLVDKAEDWKFGSAFCPGDHSDGAD